MRVSVEINDLRFADTDRKIDFLDALMDELADWQHETAQ